MEIKMEERTKMNDNELTLTDILLYIKRFFVKIMTRGIITIVIILAGQPGYITSHMDHLPSCRVLPQLC